MLHVNRYKVIPVLDEDAENFVIKLWFKLRYLAVYQKHKFRWESVARGTRMISSGLLAYEWIQCVTPDTFQIRERWELVCIIFANQQTFSKRHMGAFGEAILQGCWNSDHLHTCIKGTADIIECVFQLIKGWNGFQPASATDSLCTTRKYPSRGFRNIHAIWTCCLQSSKFIPE